MAGTTTIKEWIGQCQAVSAEPPLNRHIPCLFEDSTTSWSLAGTSTPTKVFTSLVPLMDRYNTVQARLEAPYAEEGSTSGKQGIPLTGATSTRPTPNAQRPAASRPAFLPAFPSLVRSS